MVKIDLDNKKIEKAITFLVISINASNHNPKPVMFHSIRMATYLYSYQYNDTLIIGALLHDLLEDTDVVFEEIKEQFGQDIANMVLALSFDTSIIDKDKRWVDELNKALTYGKDALIVKTADFYDNIDYYHLAKDKDSFNHLIKKFNMFIDKTSSTMKDEQIWIDLVAKSKNITY
jgi:(p)ppGpp synthase/HD superfamily hydrolase